MTSEEVPELSGTGPIAVRTNWFSEELPRMGATGHADSGITEAECYGGLEMKRHCNLQ